MSPPWMPFYVADYLRDTRRLTPAEHGAYVLLILEYWTAGGLPDDDAQLARITGMTPGEWRKAKPTVQSFFYDGWKHGRIDEEIAKAEIKHERRSEAGKRGGKAKAKLWQKSSNASGKLPDNALASSSQPQPQKDSEAIASGASAPVYTDSRHELWGEGKSILRSLGVSERDAGSNIGRWLKTMQDDAQAVLSAIQRARDQRIINPIPWITQALKGTGNGNGTGDHRTNSASGRPQSGSDAIIAGVAAAADRRARERGAAGHGGQAPRDDGAATGTDLELFGARGD